MELREEAIRHQQCGEPGERPDKLTEAEMLRLNPDAYFKAKEMVDAIAGGELIEGYNCAECADGCGQVIEFKDVDEGGADPIQPQGFECKYCGEWSANECGERAVRSCSACLLETFALNLQRSSETLRDAIAARKYAEAGEKMFALLSAAQGVALRLRSKTA